MNYLLLFLGFIAGIIYLFSVYIDFKNIYNDFCYELNENGYITLKDFLLYVVMWLLCLVPVVGTVMAIVEYDILNYKIFEKKPK